MQTDGSARLPLRVVVADGSREPAHQRDETQTALDNSISGIRTAMVSISWTRNSLRRAQAMGSQSGENPTVGALLDRAERLLEAAEATLVAHQAFDHDPATADDAELDTDLPDREVATRPK